jgi:WhiB family redox-sensing transcriptional regulator
MSRGACQGEDPELFFPVSVTGPFRDQVTAAKAVCGRCLVQVACLSYALRSAQDGIWGGTTRDERRAIPAAVERRPAGDIRATPGEPAPGPPSSLLTAGRLHR